MCVCVLFAGVGVNLNQWMDGWGKEGKKVRWVEKARESRKMHEGMKESIEHTALAKNFAHSFGVGASSAVGIVASANPSIFPICFSTSCPSVPAGSSVSATASASMGRLGRR